MAEAVATVAVFAVGGMHCGSCAARIEQALARVAGVQRVRVDGARALVTVERDASASSEADLQQAVTAAGYTLLPRDQSQIIQVPIQPILFGLAASAGLLAFYLGIITLAQGWAHAVTQLGDDRWFVAAIALGFGTQVGLFTYLRGLHRRAAAGGVAASTGTSAAAMLACCAHHLAEILPIVGLSGAALFLNAWKTPLLWLGILMNLGGIVYLLRQIRTAQAMACHTGDAGSMPGTLHDRAAHV